ncbi:sterol carrier protein domain-containing protein [Chloroflexus sp.]|uniref:sterol carrier protein domain-containing protein n=1 Tax=Chloroflexus sp. TaxID=1904827 RepID=UPI002ACE3B1C|nr:sterol carrier protein domain-containing protein [Chloroflexus sp.]
MSHITISPLSIEIPALIDPTLVTHQQRHPRYRPDLHLIAATDSGDQAIGLVTHTRWQRQLARFEVGEVELAGSSHPDLVAALLAAAAEAAVAAGMAWLRCTLPLRVASQWGMILATLDSRVAWHGSDGSLAPATLDDVADLVALDQHAPAPRCVIPLRYEADWRWQIAAQPPLVASDRFGNVTGYAMLHGESVIEGRAVDAGAARALLGRLPNTVRELWLTPDHPLAQAALELGASVTVRLPRDDAVTQVWIAIDPLAALRSQQPALAARLAASRYAGWEGSIGLRGEWGSARIECRASAAQISAGAGIADIEVAQITIGGLSTLLLGRRSASDLRATGDLRCASHEVGLVEALFPAAW